MKQRIKRIFLIISSCATVMVATLVLTNFHHQRVVVQAFEQATQVMDGLKTAQFEMNSTMDVLVKMRGQYQGIRQEAKIEMTGKGQVDLEKRRLSAQIQASALGNKMSAVEIVDGNDIYLKFDNRPFVKHSLGELNSNSLQTAITPESFKKQQLWSNLDKENSYQFLGEEEVDGQIAYKYKLNSDINSYFQNYMDEMTQPLIDMYAQLGLNIGQDDISFTMGDDIECYVWVNKENKMPIKQYSYLDNFTLSIKDFADISYENVVIEMFYQQIDQPVEIEIPQL